MEVFYEYKIKQAQIEMYLKGKMYLKGICKISRSTHSRALHATP